MLCWCRWRSDVSVELLMHVYRWGRKGFCGCSVLVYLLTRCPRVVRPRPKHGTKSPVQSHFHTGIASAISASFPSYPAVHIHV